MDYTKTLHVYVRITVIISTLFLLLLFNLPFVLPLYHVLPWERETVLLAYLCVFSSCETVHSNFVDVRLLSLAMRVAETINQLYICTLIHNRNSFKYQTEDVGRIC
jgi:hypothetical protein